MRSTPVADQSLEFDEATHTYRLGGAVVPSVTQIIAPLTAEALASIPRAALERKRAIGAAVHMACELDDEGSLDESTVAPEVTGYLAGWRRFKVENVVPHWTYTERLLASPKKRYAGRMDRCGILRGELATVDIKTVDKLDAAIGVQLAGYQQLIEESLGIKPTRRYAVQLRPDGTYHVAPYTSADDLPCFNALLSVHHWRKKHP